MRPFPELQIQPSIALTHQRSALLNSCSVLIKRDERFAKTGVGWIVRELSRHDKEAVREFVESHRKSFSPESIKNALKYVADSERKKYLPGLQPALSQTPEHL